MKLRRPARPSSERGVDDGYGRVYVFRIALLDGTILHKVGMCSSARSIDRMMEVLRSFFIAYRYVPMCTLRKDKKTKIPLLLEKHMHEVLDEFSYKFDKKFDGSTEFFKDLDEDVLLDYLKDFDDYQYLGKQTSLETKYYDLYREEMDKRRQETNTIGTDELPF